MKCHGHECLRDATHVTTWRSPAMSGPAFWYECDEHAAATRGVFEVDHPYYVWSQRAILDDPCEECEQREAQAVGWDEPRRLCCDCRERLTGSRIPPEFGEA